MQRAQTPEYAWMLDLLYAGHSVAWAASGELPPGYLRAEQLAVLPSAPGRSFLVSLASRRGAASALTSYNALRPAGKRLARSALGLALAAGLAGPVLSGKVDVGVRKDSADSVEGAGLLSRYLSDLFGVSSVAVAYGAGDGPYRKPVLQVFGSAGEPLGYVKIGWNDWTRDGVRREASALAAAGRRRLDFGVPGLVGLFTWQGLDLLVTAPLPRGVRGVGAAAPLPPAATLAEIASLSERAESTLAASAWWSGVRARIRSQVADPSARASLERAAAAIEQDFGRVILPFGFCHGDLVPWNLATLAGRLYAWDWESSLDQAPLGFDAVHYHFQVAFVGHGQSLADAVAIAGQQARPALRELGVPASSCALVATLHLVELFLRHEQARRAAATADPHFYPAVVAVLEQQLGRSRAGVPSTVGRVA